MDRNEFDRRIGQLDRSLSEFLGLFSPNLDEEDRQTLKHHADDLIGCGKKMHAELAKPVARFMSAEEYEQARKQFQHENPPWS